MHMICIFAARDKCYAHDFSSILIIIHTLEKSAKVSEGPRQRALNTVYKGALISKLAYGIPA